jgi:hypothetical protein
MSTITTRSTVRQGSSKWVVAVAVITSGAAFALGPALFTPAAGSPTPTGAQVPLFVLLAALEAAVLGIGVVVALRGRRALRRLFSSDARTTAAHAAIVWALGSWWLHDNLHMANGTDLSGLLAIEYGFHVTMMVAAVVLAWVFAAEARDRTA